MSTLLNNYLFEEITQISEIEKTTINSITNMDYRSEVEKRFIEKNIRMIAKYYKNILFSKVGKFLDLNTTSVEEIVSEMIENGLLQAKIDRPKQLIKFESLVI